MKMKITSLFLKKYHPALLQWYDKNHRKLPWRDSDDAYAIWISEVMLQQTQVRTVIPYYTRFMDRYPTVQKLANARQQTVLKLWEGLGYYSRARNLHRTAKKIVQEYNGLIPQDWQQIRILPGIGDYIAAAVLSIAFNQAYAVLDGNVKRVISRMFCLDSPINQSSAKKEFSLIADNLLYRSASGLYNQAVMELGALICTPSNPVCDKCPINFLCKAYQTSSVPVFPKRIKSKSTPSRKMVTGVIIKEDKILITQRPEKGLLGGLWEFPGGQILNGEGTREACIRCVKELSGLNIEIQNYLTSVKHAYTHFKIEIDVFLCRTNSTIIRLNGPIDYRWIDFDDIHKYPLHKANHKFLPRVREALKER
jgi:A/G-specific adenine glycosylase